ncbi:MAG: hypothetical protein HFF84_09655 [Oscillibacter sp.]|nr:hypothetical protein [Oscillibacter sp.]
MEKIKDCPVCHCKSTVIKTVFGYGVECEKNGHLHNIGLFETEGKAIAAWNFWVGNVETPIV